MNNSTISLLSRRFQIKLAQTSTAQSADVEDKLRELGALPSPEQIAPLLNIAKIEEQESVKVFFNIDSTFNTKFNCTGYPAVTDDNKVNSKNIAILNKKLESLNKLLNNNFSQKISRSLKDSGLKISDHITVSGPEFK